MADIKNPYASKSPLTQTEAYFYKRLKKALPEYTVFAQVQLSSFIRVNRSLVPDTFYMWFNPIAQQSVDYLVCDETFKVVTAIELDDKTHLNKDAIKRDEKKNKNIAAAGIHLIRWHAEDLPSVLQIQEKIHSLGETPVSEPYIALDVPEMQKDTAFQTDWNKDFQKYQFSKGRKKSSELVRFLIWITLLGILFYVFYSHMNKAFTKLITKPSSFQIYQPAVPMYSTNSVNQNTLLENQLKTLEAQKARERERKRMLEDAALKEWLWESYFRKSSLCRMSHEKVITCGNDRSLARQKYEQEWAMGKRQIDDFRFYNE